jgi:hypothetical protein
MLKIATFQAKESNILATISVEEEAELRSLKIAR